MPKLPVSTCMMLRPRKATLQQFNRINYNVSQAELKESCRHFAVKILGLDKKVARKGFTFDQAVTFLHKLRRDGPDAWMKKPLNEIWENLFGMSTKIITHKEFLKKFLHEVAGAWKSMSGMVLSTIFQRLLSFTVIPLQQKSPSKIQ